MTTMTRVNVATREAVGHLEHRFGRKRVYIFGGFIAFVLLLLLLRAFTGRQKATPPPAPRPVDVAKVIQKDVPLYLDEIGTCTAFETVQVQAQVSGQITARNFQDGADVKKGDVLFTIDSRPYQAVLDQAQGQLAQAKSQLVLDQITLKRQQGLRAKNVTSPQDLDAAQGTVNNDEAKVKSAEGTVASAQWNVDNCNVRSPIDGRAGLRLVDVGNIVGSGSTGGGAVLVTIQGIDPIYTDFTVAEPDLPLVRKYLGGPNVKVMTDAEDDLLPPREGNLSFMDNALQSGSGTVKARAVTPNPDRALWPSQFVHVRFILDILKNSKLVPSGAVQIGQNGPYIFVVKPDLTLDLRQVKPGQRQGDLTVITEGVNSGETVVVSGQLQLAPGTKVAPREIEQGSSLPSSKALN
ncbi:MAG TPA: efflux RND transporter periplasmic adaptor subunit [Chthoniobacterales bacterium]